MNAVPTRSFQLASGGEMRWSVMAKPAAEEADNGACHHREECRTAGPGPGDSSLRLEVWSRISSPVGAITRRRRHSRVH